VLPGCHSRGVSGADPSLDASRDSVLQLAAERCHRASLPRDNDSRDSPAVCPVGPRQSVCYGLRLVYPPVSPFSALANVVSAAIHYIIFQQQNSFTIDGQLVPIRNGLRNWIEIWERYLETPISNSSHGLLQDDCLPPDVMWRRVGFVRYSAEYWLLGSLLTDRIAMKMSPPEDEQGIPETSPPGALPSSSGPRSKPRSVEPILNKYDQTSMRQVNDLITDFKRFHVG